MSTTTEAEIQRARELAAAHAPAISADLMHVTAERDTLRNQVQGLTDTLMHDNARDVALRLHRAETERDAARADSGRLAAMLNQIQWRATINGWNGCCPICDEMEYTGHAEACRLNATLAAHRKAAP